jgi:carboxylesterase type B
MLVYVLTAKQDTGGFYNFSNIRYAAPPVGNSRFNKPQAPAINRSVIQTGNVGRVCPQSIPQWIFEGLAFVTNYTQGLPFNTSEYVGPGFSVTQLPQDGRTTEDCLFVDVVVPEKVLQSAADEPKAPVLVWIHGGGYAEGSKSDYGIPAEIEAKSNDIIFVSINYRLGAFGWLSGPSLQANGVGNAGLYDQAFALKWVQEHIASFGGDPNQVTVIGESAGAGSILLQITVSRRFRRRAISCHVITAPCLLNLRNLVGFL